MITCDKCAHWRRYSEKDLWSADSANPDDFGECKKLTFHFGNRRATSLFMLWMPRSIKPNSAPAEILDATNMKVRPAMESKPIELTETREFLLEAALIKARESIESGSKGLRNVTCNTGTEAYQQAEQGIKDALTSINSVLGE